MKSIFRMARALVVVFIAMAAQALPNGGPGHFILVDANDQEVGWVTDIDRSFDLGFVHVIRDVVNVPLIGLVANVSQTPESLVLVRPATLVFASTDCTGTGRFVVAGGPPKETMPWIFFLTQDPGAMTVRVADESATPTSFSYGSIWNSGGFCIGTPGSATTIPAIDTGYDFPAFVPPFRITTRARLGAANAVSVPPWTVPVAVGVILGLLARRAPAFKAGAA